MVSVATRPAWLYSCSMSLPSNIARYDSVEIPDFDQLEYMIAKRSVSTRLPRTWTKCEECERRETVFDWATWALARPIGRTRMMNDLGSAFLLSFEATRQVLKDEMGQVGLLPQGFEKWLTLQPPYDLELRGLRTLRHLEAHVRTGELEQNPDRLVDSRFAGPTPGGRAPWHWSPIATADLTSLRSPRLLESELQTWNRRCEALLVRGLMLHGLVGLRELIQGAE